MEDEDNNKTEQKGEEVVETPKENVSIVDEARAIRDEIKQEREKLEEANKKKETLQAEEMLGGTSEAGQEPVKKEETKEEIAEKFNRGELDILEK
mgnify:CR=1 FL=1